MTQCSKKYFIIMLVISVSMLSSHAVWAGSEGEVGQETIQAGAPAAPQVNDGSKDSRMNHIDFGNTYIIGQTIKSGAVYLLQRKKSEIRSMLKYREDYRQEILDGFSVESPHMQAMEQGSPQADKGEQKGSGRFVSQQ
jgi:hypothetical protein